MSTIIERLNNTTYALEELNIITLDFIVSSPEYRHNLEEIEGMDGVVDLGTTEGPRRITLELYFEADEVMEYAEKRDEVFEIFASKEPFYVIDGRSPGKKWLVKVDRPFAPSQVRKYGLFQVELIAIKGRAESIGTSTMASTFEHLQDMPVTYTDYTMHATKFKIYNAGVTIDPRNINHYLKITYKGNSENLRIRNITTGDEWAYNGVSNPEDVIVLEGIRSTKNGLSIFRQTNKRLITLAHGWNEFEIYGAPDATQYAIQVNMPPEPLSEPIANPLTFEFKFLF